MSRNRKLYLSELILRLSNNTLNGITIIYENLLVIWHYENKDQAIKDLKDRVLWNIEVDKYTIIDNHMQIILK